MIEGGTGPQGSNEFRVIWNDGTDYALGQLDTIYCEIGSQFPFIATIEYIFV